MPLSSATSGLTPEIAETEVAKPHDLDELLQRGYRFAFSLTHERTKAEDLVQDAWLAILKTKAPHTPAYLFTTIRNRFIDQWRRSKIVDIRPLEDHQNGKTEWMDTWSIEKIHARKESIDKALEGLNKSF